MKRLLILILISIVGHKASSQCTTVSTFPYVEDFDGSAWSVPFTMSSCWTGTPGPSASSWSWLVYTGNSYVGSRNTGVSSDVSGSGKYLFAYSDAAGTAGQTCELQLPSFDLTSLATPTLEFAYHMFGTSMGKLEVEVKTATGNWTLVDSIVGQQQFASTDGWQFKTIDLAAYSSTNTQIRLIAYYGAQSAGDINIDEVRVSNASLCTAPNQYSISNLTATSANITFPADSGATRYIEWGPTGFTQGTYTTVSSTSDTLSLSGLPADSCIEFYIWADCIASGNGLSAFKGPYTLCTPCVNANLNYSEDFNAWPLQCVSVDAGTISWSENNGWAQASLFGLNGLDFIMDMQKVDISADARVSFRWSHNYLAANPNDNLALLARPETSSVWDTLWNRTGPSFNSQDGATNFVPGMGAFERIILPTSYTGQVVEFRLHAISDGGPRLFVDDFVVDSVPACIDPIGFSVVALTDTSAAVIWTGDTTATSSTIEYGLAGFSPGNGITVNGSKDSIFISGLTSNTAYDLYVSVLCPNTASASNRFTFSTECPFVVSAPFIEDFSMTSYGPADALFKWENCFTTNAVTVSSPPVLRWESAASTGANSNTSNTGPHFDNTTPNTAGGGYMYLETSWSGTERELYSPNIEMSSLVTPTLEFAYHMYGSVMGDLHVDIWDGTAWTNEILTISGQQQMAGSDPWLLAEIPLNEFIGDTIQIRWRGTYPGFYTGDLAIDDVSIDNGESCSVVSYGRAENIAATTADLNWYGFTSSNYSIEWGTCGFSPGSVSGTIVNNVQSGYTLSGLSPNVCYEFYVTNNCDTSGTLYGPYSFNTVCTTLLNGTYTVGGSAGPNNFPDIMTAVAELACGVTGPVTFQIMSSDTLTNNLQIGSINGASGSNRITFDGMGSATLYKDLSVTGPMWNLDGADYITLKDMTLIDSSATDAVGVRITGDSDHNIIENNTLIIAPGSFYQSTAGIAVTGSSTSVTSPNTNVNNLIVRNNIIRGSNYGLSCYGGTNLFNKIDSLRIEGNLFEGQYQYGIIVYYFNEVVLKDNEVTGLLSPSINYGAYLNYNDNIDIIGNKLEGDLYGLYSAGMNFTDANGEANIINNMIHGMGTNTSTAAVYTRSSSQNVNVFHNTVVSDLSTAWLDQGTSSMDFRNNIIVGGIEVMDFSTSPDASSTFDYNLYHRTSPGDLLEWPGAYADLAALQAGLPNHNANSRSGNPLFISATDFHVNGGLANDAGDNSVAVLEDIDGETRPMAPSTTVDIGADEYSPIGWDAEASYIFEPSGNSCGDSALSVKMIIKNIGANNITTLQANAYVSGAVNTVLSSTFSGNVIQTSQDTVTLGSINVYNGGTVSIYGTVTLANDTSNLNDTTAVVSFDFVPQEPEALPTDTLCEGFNGKLYAVPHPGVVYEWYENLTDTVALATGDSLSFTANKFINTYYLSYKNVGLDSIETTLGANFGCTGGNMMDLSLNKPISLEGVSIISADAAGTVSNLRVYYKMGTYEGSETNPSAWTMHEDMTFISNGGATLTHVELSSALNLPAGAVALYLDFNANFSQGLNVYSNADMTLSTGAGLCSSFGSVTQNTFNGRLVYSTASTCNDYRSPVSFSLESLPVASFIVSSIQSSTGTAIFDASASTDADSVAWDFGDGSSGSGSNVNHVYANNGTYTISLIAYNECGTDTATAIITIAGISLSENSFLQEVSLFPNPTTGIVHLELRLDKPQVVRLEVLNLQGQVLREESINYLKSEYVWESDLSGFSKGTYFVKISGERGVEVLPLTLH